MQTDETFDFFENQAEKNLLTRTGRNRPIGRKNWIPTRKEWEKMNGPVETTKLPELPTMRDRLLYLQSREAMTQKEFAKKCGIGYSTFCRYLTAGAKVARENLIAIAHACSVPTLWLLGADTISDKAVAMPQEAREPGRETNTLTQSGSASIAPGMRMTLMGVYSGSDISKYISALCENKKYKVKCEVCEIE